MLLSFSQSFEPLSLTWIYFLLFPTADNRPKVNITRKHKGTKTLNESHLLLDKDLETCEETLLSDYERFLVDVSPIRTEDRASFVMEMHGKNISCDEPEFMMHTGSRESEDDENCETAHQCHMMNKTINGSDVTCTVGCDCVTSYDCHVTVRMDRILWRPYQPRGKLCEIKINRIWYDAVWYIYTTHIMYCICMCCHLVTLQSCTLVFAPNKKLELPQLSTQRSEERR